MRQSKMLLVFGLVLMFFMLAFQPSAYATTASSHVLGIVQERKGKKLGEENTDYYAAYQANDRDVWKIVRYPNGSGSGYEWTNDIYCIKGGQGFMDSIYTTGTATYNKKYDMKNLNDSNFNIFKNIVPDYTTVQTATINGQQVQYTNYNAVLWILDNMYLPNATNAATLREKLLKGAFADKLNDTELLPRFTLNDITLEDTDIETVQQLAIWHFTNSGDNKYDIGQTVAIQIKERGSASYGAFGDNGTDANRQTDCMTLYTYLINNAMIHANEYGTSANRNLTAPIKLIPTTLKTETIGSNIVVGPIRIEKQSDLAFDLTSTVTSQNGTEVTNYSVMINKGETNEEIKTAPAGQKAIDANITDLLDKDFYIVIPSTEGVTYAMLDISANYYESDIEVWTTSSPNTDQPVVIVEKKEKNYKASSGKKFDLALRKFITKVNSVDVTKINKDADTKYSSRVPKVEIDNNGKITYKHPKQDEIITVETGDIVTYTIRVYNEGPLAGYVEEIKDDIPEGLEFLDPNNKKAGTLTQAENDGYDLNEQYEWTLTSDGKYIVTPYRDSRNASNLLNAFDAKTMTEPKHVDVEVAFRVIETDTSKTPIINTAEISAHADVDKNREIEDIDSIPDNHEDGPGKDINGKGEKEDDIDKEYLQLKSFDLALRKFITQVNETELIDKSTKKYTREPVVTLGDFGKVINGKQVTSLTYTHPKDPVLVAENDVVVYTIRVYNEGQVDGFAEQITDYLPEGTKFIDSRDGEKYAKYAKINQDYRWKLDATDTNERTITTDYLSFDQNDLHTTLLKAFDGKAITKENYKDVKVAVIVTEKDITKILTNMAEISEDKDKNGNDIDDRDSTPNNKKDGEDDIDYEHLKLSSFDLALRKFITDVDGKAVTTRIPVAKVDDKGKVVYEHTKAPVMVTNSSLVTYTIRVYNEGTSDGYASLIKDDIPAGLIFLPDNATNKQYGWTYENNDKKAIVTEYLAKKNGIDNGLLKAFDGKEMKEENYKDIKVVFQVTNERLGADRILINTAQIADDSDVNGNEVNDIDSIPNNNNQDKSETVDTKEINQNELYHYFKEDDIDKEYVIVKYFDLALLKWVDKVIYTVDGTTTERDTGHTGLENPEPVVKQEVDRKKLKSTVVKFEYTIKITNEGDIAGYAKEISDYIPEGLEFVQEDNPNWTIKDGKVVTRALEGTLLQPGQSADVKIILRWINNSENMGVKINVAEISEDHNQYGIKDIDSIPNNKKDGEDDIDTAPVALSIKTGDGNVIYFGLAGLVLATITGGVALIKKYVL